MHLSLFQVLNVVVLFLLGFIVVFLFTNPKGRRVSSVLLGSFFLAWALIMLDHLAFTSGFYHRHPSAAFSANQSPWLLGPLLWLYTRSRVYRDFRLRPRDLLHGLPFLIVSLGTQVWYQALPLVEKRAFIDIVLTREGTTVLMGTTLVLATLLIFVQLFVYLFLSLRTIRHYRSVIQEQFSSIDAINLSWLNFTLGVFCLVLVGALIQNLVRFSLRPPGGETEFILMNILLLFFLSAVLFRSLRHTEVFAGIPEEPASKKRKKEVSSLPHAELEAHKERLETWMQTEKPFLDPSLTLQALADQLSLPARTLSQVVNQAFGQNFFDFINRYRIEEAKRLLHSPDHAGMTILRIMYTVGFNSKSSFNTAFKKHTHMTPSQFKAGAGS